MKLVELRTFLAIVETGSLARASDSMNVTQSTVTARLQALEAGLGQPLIRRQKSGATLTPAGERLRGYAQTINDLWRQARQETALPDGASIICNIALEPELWTGMAQLFFDRLRHSQPDVVVSIWQGSRAEVAEWLANGKADVAFTYGSARSARQLQHSLPPDDLVLVSSCETGPVRGDPGYVFVQAGEAFLHDHAVAYADAGIARISFGSASMARDHILAEGGSAYLPRRLVSEDIAQGRLYQMDAPVFERAVFLTLNQIAVSDWPWFKDCLAVLEGIR